MTDPDHTKKLLISTTDEERQQIADALIRQTEKIKLIRGMKGQCGWEISILEINPDRVAKIDAEMQERFPNGD